MAAVKYFKLDGREVVPCKNVMEWAAWFDGRTGDRIICQTDMIDYFVSTVFVGIWTELNPHMFETAIFSTHGNVAEKDHIIEEWHSMTHQQAVSTHEHACQHVLHLKRTKAAE